MGDLFVALGRTTSALEDSRVWTGTCNCDPAFEGDRKAGGEGFKGTCN